MDYFWVDFLLWHPPPPKLMKFFLVSVGENRQFRVSRACMGSSWNDLGHRTQNCLALWLFTVWHNAWVNVMRDSAELEECWWIFSCSPALTTLTHRALFRNCYSSYLFLFDLYRVHCLWDSWVCGRKILESEIKRSAVWSWKARKLPEHPESTFLMCKIKRWCACLLE